MRQAEKRLGLRFKIWKKYCIPIDKMLKQDGPKGDGIREEIVEKTKQKVYDHLIEYIESEGYPIESDEDFKEANVNDLVIFIIAPILAAFRRETGREIYLHREKDIVSIDKKFHGYEAFVMMDFIGMEDGKHVLVVEAKKSSIGQAKWQCLLALKDMLDNNLGGVVYGFVTAGVEWQMIRYDGKDFTQTGPFQVLFRTMGYEKEEWMKRYSVVVDCIHMALRGGGSGATGSG